MQALRQFGEKLNTAIPTVQSKVELERSNIDSTDGLVASQPRSRSGFSVKNILAVEDLDSALPSIPWSTSPRLHHNLSPLITPCATFSLSLCSLPVIWTRINPGIESLQRRAIVANFSIMNQLSAGFALYANLQRRRISTKKKQRPMFSQQQVKAIENELAKHRYITENKRAELFSTLNLTEMQVKTWFQNRRTKWRKDLQN